MTSIPDAGYEEHHKFPKGHWVKVSKICSPAPSAVKNNLLVMLVNTSANDNVEFTDVKILLFILLAFMFKCKYH